MKSDSAAVASTTPPNARMTSAPTPIIRKRRADSYAGEAACSFVSALILRGSVTAASGVAYRTSSSVTSRSSSCAS